MRRALTALAMLVAAPPAWAGGVASAGICADHVVLALVDRGRVVAVSPQAGDPSQSLVSGEAAGLPAVAPSAEALILAGADTVVLNTYGDGKTKALLERLGVTVLRVPYDERLEGIPASLRRLGRGLGAPDRGDELAAGFERRMEAVRAGAPAVPVVAAYYRPDGGSAGAGTYVAEAMAAAGYDSLSGRLGRRGWGRLDLETLVLNPPQALVVSFFDHRDTALRRSFGRHPVLRAAFAHHPVVEVPGRMWGCGGWPVMVAAEHMAEHRP